MENMLNVWILNWVSHSAVICKFNGEIARAIVACDKNAIKYSHSMTKITNPFHANFIIENIDAN